MPKRIDTRHRNPTTGNSNIILRNHRYHHHNNKTRCHQTATTQSDWSAKQQNDGWKSQQQKQHVVGTVRRQFHSTMRYGAIWGSKGAGYPSSNKIRVKHSASATQESVMAITTRRQQQNNNKVTRVVGRTTTQSQIIRQGCVSFLISSGSYNIRRLDSD